MTCYQIPYRAACNVLAAAALWPAGAGAAPPVECRQAELAVQVLGSGGPELAGGRAASGYLLWRGGRSVAHDLMCLPLAAGQDSAPPASGGRSSQ